MARNTSQRFLLFSLFCGLSQPSFAWKEAMMVLSNFLNFFAIFLEFPIPGWVETHRNEFCYFLSFSAFPILFWLEMKLCWCFLIFWIFLLFFKIFYYGSVRNTSERFFFLFSLFHSFSQPIFAWKGAMMVFSNFLNFFAIFLEFSFLGKVETHQNEFCYFLSFSAFPILFWLEMKLWWCFLIFWIFCNFF